MSVTWQDYRMWRRPPIVVAVGGNSSESLGDWKATEHTFRGRTQEEAQRKAEKFWRESEFGAGLMVCIPEGSTPGD